MSDNLFLVRKDGKFGFINDRGHVVIDFVFENVSPFFEGLARIVINDKVGFIDTKGNIKIQPQFASAFNFSEGLAIAELDYGYYGYIDASGEFAIKPKFFSCHNFENGYALAKHDPASRFYFIDKFGNIKLKGRDFGMSSYRDGLINCPHNGFFFGRGNWGFVDINGDFVIRPTYKFAKEFSEEKAAVVPKKINGKANIKNRYAFINKKNEIIIPPLYVETDLRFSEGMCTVYDNGYGYINNNGQLIIPCDYYAGRHFSEGLAVVVPKGESKKLGYIDRTGAFKIKPIFAYAESFKNGHASVTIGDKYEELKYGYININGDYIWEPTR
jgi:hypothetical protein